jgi:hypothetical protein
MIQLALNIGLLRSPAELAAFWTYAQQ